MLDYFVNVYWAHPVAISAAVIAVIIILVWMAGSGSRQRFIVLKRTKETDQLARDVSRIASALEKIAKQREIPTDYRSEGNRPARARRQPHRVRARKNRQAARDSHRL